MKRLIVLVFIVFLLFAGNAWAKQWDAYSDMGDFPDPTDTWLIYDHSQTTESEMIQEVSVSTFFGALQLKPVWVDLTGTSTYTINQALGNVFFINTVGATGNTGVSVFLPNIGAGTSQFANRPYWVIDDTVSGTTKIWLVPQYNTSQCTQWVVAGTGVTSGQTGVSLIGHERMDSRMDSVMIIPRYVSGTGGVTHYVVDENIH